MASDLESQAEPKDRTKYMWGAVILIFAILVAALAFQERVTPNTSMVRMKHILIRFNAGDPSDEARAREVVRGLRERILKGESFGKLAEEFSNDPQSASRGGDLGPMEKGTLTDSMERFAWTAPIGQLSDVIKSSYGYHIAVVTERYISEIDRLEIERKNQERQNPASGESSQPEAAPAAPAQ
ncbi:MAG: peptidylprolyl isomerase [Candidatus Hydrogenedentes bacterium]|nr:peptidylprolyl isomerase [Candidatus Hydrogenedentota bacterium]